MRKILETKHPSLYWYISKDRLDDYFDQYYATIADSMTERAFTWKILAPMVAKIHCGHTSIMSSKAYVKWASKKKYNSFPLMLRCWNDSMVVVANLNKKDSVLKRGTILTSINHQSFSQIKEKMFDYLPIDGFSDNGNYIRLSGNFPYYHRNIYGLDSIYEVTYLDSNGIEKSVHIPWYLATDTSKIKTDSSATSTAAKKETKKKLSRKEKLEKIRDVSVDSSSRFAIMNLNSFQKGHLRRFFRKSFRSMDKQQIPNLILDLRMNGGGKVMNSTLLTKYISRAPFRISDSLYAVSNSVHPYGKYIQGRWLNTLAIRCMTRRGNDGMYHNRRMEKKFYPPRKRHHYDGHVYVLMSGATFSASSLFCNAIKGQNGITLAGEESGGGWHGNNGIIIPNITLPHTGIRVRLPLFRLIQFNHPPKDGRGVTPDLEINPTVEAIKKGRDRKMEVIKATILKKAS